ncbi:hypothetical protein GCM10010182_10350 [Actinomadura cremea]|nr:hypothetical protein GCM10010182_10350 [Actinomadura cremea]
MRRAVPSLLRAFLPAREPETAGTIPGTSVLASHLSHFHHSSLAAHKRLKSTLTPQRYSTRGEERADRSPAAREHLRAI